MPVLRYPSGSVCASVNTSDGTATVLYPSGSTAVSLSAGTDGLQTHFFAETAAADTFAAGRPRFRHPLARGSTSIEPSFRVTRTGDVIGSFDQRFVGSIVAADGRLMSSAAFAQLPEALEVNKFLSIQSDTTVRFKSGSISIDFPSPKWSAVFDRAGQLSTLQPDAAADHATGASATGTDAASPSSFLSEFSAQMSVLRQSLKGFEKSSESRKAELALARTGSSESAAAKMPKLGVDTPDATVADPNAPLTLSPLIRRSVGKYVPKPRHLVNDPSKLAPLRSVSSKQFESFIASSTENAPVMVCCTASWVPGSASLDRVWQTVNAELGGWQLVRFDMSESDFLKSKYKIATLPCFLIYSRGKLVWANHTFDSLPITANVQKNSTEYREAMRNQLKHAANLHPLPANFAFAMAANGSLEQTNKFLKERLRQSF